MSSIYRSKKDFSSKVKYWNKHILFVLLKRGGRGNNFIFTIDYLVFNYEESFLSYFTENCFKCFVDKRSKFC